MAPLVFPITALRVLCILLLQAAPLRTQHNSYDNPICLESVSVTRGEKTIKSCNISNPLKTVSISLRVSGRDPQFLFRDKPPGLFSETGWQLWVEGGMAQLVIEEAQDIHSGTYIWFLHGMQSTIRITSLNVSASPDLSPFSENIQNIPFTPAVSQSPAWNSCPILLLIPTVLLGAVLLVPDTEAVVKGQEVPTDMLVLSSGTKEDQESVKAQ